MLAISATVHITRRVQKLTRKTTNLATACYLTSEGFYRYWHREFGNYLNWARGSLGEALDQINEGGESGYFTPDVHTTMKRICIRALKANVALRKSWRRSTPSTLQHPPAPYDGTSTGSSTRSPHSFQDPRYIRTRG